MVARSAPPSGRRVEVRRPAAAEPLAELGDLARWIASRVKVLELGCGDGANALWLAERGFATTAVEASPERVRALRIAAAHRGLEMRVVEHPVASYPIRGAYDVILAQDAPLGGSRDECLGFLARVREHTRRGGFNLIVAAAPAAIETGAGPRPLADGDLFERYPDWRVLLRQSYLVDGPAPSGTRWVNRLLAQRP